MLKFTKKVDYSILILVHLTQHPDLPVSAKEFAVRYRLSVPLVANLMKTLSRAELIESSRGKHGGYRLNQPPERITLGRVVGLVEGSFALTDCAPEHKGEVCCLQDICVSRRPLQVVHRKIMSFLDTTTIAELAAQPQAPLAAASGG